MYEVVSRTCSSVGRRDLDVEVELLAAGSEERVGNGAASQQGGAIIPKCVYDLVDDILVNQWMHRFLSLPCVTVGEAREGNSTVSYTRNGPEVRVSTRDIGVG